jgi:tetratricopeptide (TPR) repeat protein
MREVIMRKALLLVLSILLLAPAMARAANTQAQEYDELGQALYRQGLYAKAISYFQNAVQTDPADWQGYENLGNAYFKINDNADALSAYQKSLQINPNNTTLENIVQSLQANTPSGDGNSASDNTQQPVVNRPREPSLQPRSHQT